MKLTTLFSQSNLCLCLPHDDDTDTLLVPIGLFITAAQLESGLRLYIWKCVEYRTVYSVKEMKQQMSLMNDSLGQLCSLQRVATKTELPLLSRWPSFYDVDRVPVVNPTG